jgi:hypothetical protein
MIEVSGEKYTEATLCFPIRDDRVLLAEKQKKLGAGFLNGFGDSCIFNFRLFCIQKA